MRASATVLPITHSPPSNPALAVEIPHETKRRLGLDDERSWIVLTEANRFAWPVPDLRPPQPGMLESVAYGLLPRALFKEIATKLADAIAVRFGPILPSTTSNINGSDIPSWESKA